MRLSLLALLGVATLAQSAATKKKVVQPTVFNGVQVPALFELTPTNWEEEYKKTKWLMIKHYR
jgi:protein disulfide-isomerase